MTKDQIKDILQRNGLVVKKEDRLNNAGWKLTLENGCIVNCWDKGTFNLQGHDTDTVKKIIDCTTVNGMPNPSNRKIFVVYGHDDVARTQLEAMLRRWNLEPIILDQLPSEGKTIIEKLEEHITSMGYGIVLATPDDLGYPRTDEAKKKYRVRQNVVLELGMLLSRLGRDKTAILLSTKEDMEKPSDIEGLIYIPFKENVEETKTSLAKELSKHGYFIDVGLL